MLDQKTHNVNCYYVYKYATKDYFAVDIIFSEFVSLSLVFLKEYQQKRAQFFYYHYVVCLITSLI